MEHSALLKKMKKLDIGSGQSMWEGGLTSLLSLGDPMSKIKSSNIIAEFCEICPAHVPQKVLNCYSHGTTSESVVHLCFI